ncbi:hypothetical protein Fot_12045 [Forsythia ovata]|uniref:Uncharacterized protein n=1 Tax=Forsythia ovata TaxID=205694 RepID=A0ABD1WLE5_9LAMI
MRGGIVEDVSLPHLASPTVSGSRPTVLQGPETVVGNPPIPPAPGDTGLLPGTLGHRQKENQRSRVENKRPGRLSLSLLAGVSISTLGPAKTSWIRQSVEKLPSAVALAATSVHKYWTSSFGKAVDTVEVTELKKLAEMYTSRSHVLNCELYKILEMKVDEIQSALGEDENVEVMRAEIKRLKARLVFSEDARSRATYDVTKAQTIQKACIVAQKKAESQLKSCQNMIQAKDRELTEVLNELAKAKSLLAKLGVLGYTET